MHLIQTDWSYLKSEFLSKNFLLNHNIVNNGYKVYIQDRNILWVANVLTSDEIEDFETNYKENSNKCLYASDGKQFFRAESRPLDYTTWFTCRGDSDTEIGKGTVLSWDFSNDDDLVNYNSGDEYKTKRIEFKFLDPIAIKEGAIYFKNAPQGSFIDLHVVCPANNYYYKNDGTPAYTTEDLVISHYVNHHLMFDDCPMGDELNTESCSNEIPSHYKFWLEVTVPSLCNDCSGHVSLETYRKRTVILE